MKEVIALKKFFLILLLIILLNFSAGCFDKSEKINSLIKDLGNSKNMQVVEKASGELVDMGEVTVPYLVDAIYDDNEVMRKNAAFVLGRIGSSEAVIPLIGILEDIDYNVRDAAAMALGMIGDKEALPALKKALEKEENPKVIKYLEKAIEKLEK